MSERVASATCADVRGPGPAWMRFWFTPADPRPLALVRILVGLLGLALLWSWGSDLDGWFGPRGLVSPEAADAWASRGDGTWLATVDAVLGPRGPWLVALLAFVGLVVGAGGSATALAAAGSWSLLLHRAPMLVGPADDCLAVLTWCVAVAPSTAVWSCDHLLADRRRAAPAAVPPEWRARLAVGLMQVHASVIALAAALAQLKGDVWWDGTAAWWLAARADSRIVNLTTAYAGSTYVMNLVTHLIPAFEATFALGLWWSATRPIVARIGILAWPVIGVVVGEPFWGLAMAVFTVPFIGVPWPARGMKRSGVSHRAAVS